VNVFTLKYLVDEMDSGKLLREFLKEKQISKTALTEIKFFGGGLFANNVRVTVRYPLKAGDEILVQFPREIPSEDVIPEAIPLNIVYEDDYLLVIDKPANMASIPSREHRKGTLANALLHYYQSCGYGATIHIVTRLDRDTTGLMLVAKHRHAHHLFSLQQKKYAIKRRYEAIAHGMLEMGSGRIEAPIGRKDTSIIEREVRSDGQQAITNYEVLGGFPDYSHVSLWLETGRTHQIRVHMAHLGHPLAGDTLYGGEKTHIARQALHSCELSFYHPVREMQLSFHSSLPEDMSRLVEKEEC